MAYTPTTWATGDTITASAMNKIENGIAGAGGISPVACCIWFPNSTLGFQVYGDFNSALQLVQQGFPIVGLWFPNYSSSSIGFDSNGVNVLGAAYYTEYPNRIDFLITAGVGFHWTENGVEYFD